MNVIVLVAEHRHNLFNHAATHCSVTNLHAHKLLCNLFVFKNKINEGLKTFSCRFFYLRNFFLIFVQNSFCMTINIGITNLTFSFFEFADNCRTIFYKERIEDFEERCKHSCLWIIL